MTKDNLGLIDRPDQNQNNKGNAELNRLHKELNDVERIMEKMKRTSVKDWTDSYRDYEVLNKYQDLKEKIKKKQNDMKVKNRKNNGNALGCNSNHDSEKELYNKPVIEKLKRINVLLNFAEELLQQGNLELSKDFMKNARVWISYTFPEDQSHTDELRNINLKVDKILGEINFEEGFYNDSISYCDKALSIKWNDKYALIKSRSLLKLSKIKEAKEILIYLKHNSNDALLKREIEYELNIINKTKLNNKTKEKEMATKMFN